MARPASASKPIVKDLDIIKIQNTALFGLKFRGGGELPKVLSGMYTNPTLAQKAIDKYLQSR